jgi:hypothetical protein
VNVRGTVAIPEPLVRAVVECNPPVHVPEAPVDGETNVTVEPLTGFANASETSAASAVGNAAPAAADWLSPALTAIAAADPATTVKAALVPVSEPPERVAVIVRLAEPASVSVTDCEASTPDAKAAVVTGEPTSPAFEVRIAVPTNPATVLLKASLAVILIVNATPAVCWGMAPPPAFSTRKLLSAPGFTVNELLVPFSDPPDRVAVMESDPTLVIVTAQGSRIPLVNVPVVPPPPGAFHSM